MTRDATLHVKIDQDMADGLDNLARSRKKSKGQLVREAITTCYQTACLGLSKRQEQALSAYEGGYISIGKLADVMGMHVLELRTWLHERGMPENSSFSEKDAANA
jgi:predicted transcriptional regulator